MDLVSSYNVANWRPVWVCHIPTYLKRYGYIWQQYDMTEHVYHKLYVILLCIASICDLNFDGAALFVLPEHVFRALLGDIA